MRTRLVLLGLVVAGAAVACTDPLKPNPIEHPGLPSVTLDATTTTGPTTGPTTSVYVVPTEPTSTATSTLG